MQSALSFVLANKLKLLKNDLKRWNVEVFGNVEDSWGLSVEETLELGRVRDELEKVTLMEEIC